MTARQHSLSGLSSFAQAHRLIVDTLRPVNAVGDSTVGGVMVGTFEYASRPKGDQVAIVMSLDEHGNRMGMVSVGSDLLEATVASDMPDPAT